MPSTADGVLTGQPGAATRNLIQQNHGAPDKYSDSSCHHRTLIKENTTDTPRVFSGEPGSLLPRPHHPIPSTKMRGRGWNGKISGERIKVRGKLCRSSRVGGCSP